MTKLTKYQAQCAAALELYGLQDKGMVDSAGQALTRLLEVTSSLDTIKAYMASRTPYSYEHSEITRLHWNVYVNGFDFRPDTIKEHLAQRYEPMAFIDVDAVVNAGVVEDVFKRYEYKAWDEGVENCRMEVLGSDFYKQTRFSDHVFVYDAGFYGRQGKHFCITEVENIPKCEDDTYSPEGWFLLAMLCVELDTVLTPDRIKQDVCDATHDAICCEIERESVNRGIGLWRIIDGHEYNGVQYKRVLNILSGEESMLGTQEECEAIIIAAEAGKLNGSFGLLSLKKAAEAVTKAKAVTGEQPKEN